MCDTRMERKEAESYGLCLLGIRSEKGKWMLELDSAGRCYCCGSISIRVVLAFFAIRCALCFVLCALCFVLCALLRLSLRLRARLKLSTFDAILMNVTLCIYRGEVCMWMVVPELDDDTEMEDAVLRSRLLPQGECLLARFHYCRR